MLRRSIRVYAGNKSGNRVIGIRREDKNVWERRAPLVPDHCKELLKFNQVDKIVVQPSSTRCFHDSEYADAGAEINEDLSECGTVLAVKEVPGQLLLPDRSYMFFSHTIKAQTYNMPLLDQIVESNVRLFDYERILGPDGRMVKFGPQAGYAGVIDALNALGLALMTRGFATPFLNISVSREYRSLETARESIRAAGDRIRQHGLPKMASPIIFGVTGSGSVSMAAQEILHLLPCKYIEVEDLPRLKEKQNTDTEYIYVCVIKAKDMVVPIDHSKPFTTQHYYNHPDEYRPVFHERVAPYLSVLITGHYWEPRFPRLISTEQARDLNDKGNFPLLVLADITCDIGGSIEFFVKSTSIQNPFYMYDLNKNMAMDIQDFHGDGVVICGVDHLPAEFPREASASFGGNLRKLIPAVAGSSADVSLDEQRAFLGKSLFNAMVTMGGSLTPNYQYITALRSKNEEKLKHKKILLFGSGMMAAPCVFTLLEDAKNRMTVVDASQANLDEMHNALRKSENDLDESRVRFVRTTLDKVDSYVETLIKSSDVVISLLPATMHPIVAECTIKHKVPLVTASYISPGMEKLREAAQQSGTIVVNEMGLDPGIDLMTSAKLLNRIKSEGGVIRKYISLCGALPAPENSNCPLGYKFSWSPFGVLVAATRPSKLKIETKWYDIQGDFLYFFPQSIQNFKGLDLYWVPNGDVTKYAKVFDINEADTLIRGTIRYAGFSGCVRAFKLLGMLDNEKMLDELDTKSKNGPFIMWPELIERVAFGGDVDKKKKAMDAAIAAGFDTSSGAHEIFAWLPQVLKERLSERWAEIRSSDVYKAIVDAKLMSDMDDQPLSIENEVQEIMDQFSALRLLDEERYVPKTPNATVIHSLCRTLISRLSYKPHERDYVIMYHRIVADFEEKGLSRTYDVTMTMRGKSQTHSATAETVGVPVGLTAQLVLDGGLKDVAGLVSPTIESVYNPVVDKLEFHGIKMRETIVDRPLVKE